MNNGNLINNKDDFFIKDSSNKENVKPLFNKITLMSFIATIFVVVIHVVLQPPKAVSFFTRIAVPWFFLVSGYFATRESLTEGSFLCLMRKRCKTLIIPYLILNTFWFFAYSGLVWIATSYFGSKDILDFSFCAYIRAIGLNLFYTPTISALWYVRCLLLFLLLLPMVIMIMRRGKWLSWLIVGGIAMISTMYEFNKCAIFPLFGFNMRGLPFFLLGVHLQLWPVKVNRYLGLVVSLICVCFAAFFKVLDGVPLIGAIIAVFWFVLPSVTVPNWMRTVTFPIYVLHQMVLYVLLIPLRFINWGGGAVALIVLIILTILLSFVTAKFINRISSKISTIIFGGRV